jgi:hypothetical protein
VKRTRRVIVEIEQWSITLTQTGLQPARPPSHPIEHVCPICAAPCQRVTLEALNALVAKGLNEYAVVGGEPWVCRGLIDFLSTKPSP